MLEDPRDKTGLINIAEKYGRLAKAYKRLGSWDTWFLVVDVSGWLHGDFSDWPAYIQDPLLKAMERQCKAQPGEHVKIVIGKCYQDVPDETPYIRIVAQAFPLLEH